MQPVMPKGTATTCHHNNSSGIIARQVAMWSFRVGFRSALIPESVSWTVKRICYIHLCYSTMEKILQGISIHFIYNLCVNFLPYLEGLPLISCKIFSSNKITNLVVSRFSVGFCTTVVHSINFPNSFWSRNFLVIEGWGRICRCAYTERMIEWMESSKWTF